MIGAIHWSERRRVCVLMAHPEKWGVLLKTLLKVSLYEKAGGNALEAFPRARIKLAAIRRK